MSFRYSLFIVVFSFLVVPTTALPAEDALPGRGDTASLLAEFDADDAGEARRSPLLIHTIRFKKNQSILDPDNQSAVTALAAALAESGLDTYRLLVSGHSDATGDADENRLLSLKRAENVAEALQQILDLPSDRILVAGMGADALSPDLGKFDPRHRRVEIQLTEATDETPDGWPVPAAAGKAIDLAWDDDTSSPPDSETFAFGPQTQPRRFDLTGSAPLLRNAGTIEFWFSPQWEPDRTEAAVLLEILDGNAVLFSVRVSGDRRSLILWNADRTAAIGTDVDLTQNRAYHIALQSTAAGTMIVLDGTPLEESVGLGYASGTATALLLGGLEDGSEQFIGKVARLRLWNTLLTPDDIQELAATKRQPGIASNLYGRLGVSVVADGEELSLLRPERSYQPGATWWHHYGSDYVRVHNKVDFAKGEATACTSSHLAQLQRAAGPNDTGCGTDQVDAAGASDVSAHSIYPVYSLEWVPGEPTPDASLVGGNRGEPDTYRVSDDAEVSAIVYSYSEFPQTGSDGKVHRLQRLHGLQISERFTTEKDGNAELSHRRVGAIMRFAGGVRDTFFELEPGEAIEAVEVFADEERVAGIRLHTTQRISKWLGGNPKVYSDAGRKVAQHETLRMPEGTGFAGFSLRVILSEETPFRNGELVTEMQGEEVTALGLLVPGLELPGVVLRNEAGDATRFR